MAIINNAHRGSQINLLCLIYRVLRRAKNPKTVDEITNLCRPDSLPIKDDQKKRFSGELQFWQQRPHQLWEVDDQNRIQLTIETKSIEPSPLDIAFVTRQTLFSDVVEDVLEKKDENDVESLFRTLACLMTSGQFLPLGGDLLTKKTLDQLLDKRLLPKHSLNDESKPTLLAYGQFLGFLEPQDDGYIVDPTRAVYEILPYVFSERTNIVAKVFVEKLAECLPVLDGGKYQAQVEEVMIANQWVPNQKNYISRALSHALERLSQDKVLKLEVIADDEQAMQMQLPTGSRAISTIEFVGGNA